MAELAVGGHLVVGGHACYIKPDPTFHNTTSQDLAKDRLAGLSPTEPPVSWRNP